MMAYVSPGTRTTTRFAGCVTALACGVALAGNAVAAAGGNADWDAFKQRFVEADGRVVDDGQGAISHSEGQGYAMLLAVRYDDRTAFERLWSWTQRNLQVRDDALLAWRWDPQRRVSDRNNATDGDLLVAWALLRAGDRWQCTSCVADARRIARDVRQKLLRKTAHGLVLLPGMDGFEKPDGITVNLSYWIFPALREIARADPAPEWDELAATGMAMLQYSYFGRWGLPPDWLRLGERVAPANTERFGYDALRIPLYLLWARRETPALLKPYREFWAFFQGARFLPSWTLLKDDSVDSRDAGAGIRAIASWVGRYPDLRASALPPLDASQGYYSAVLLLLTKMALHERGED
jgi:endo-1,4-beta-D-glucanase Y